MNSEPGTRMIELSIDGMHCERCVKNVEAVMSGADGIESFLVRVGHVKVDHFPQLVDEDRIRELVETAGYEVRKPAEGRSPWKRFIDRMIRSNEKAFGTGKLDCCTVISDQEKREARNRINRKNTELLDG